MTKPLPNRQQFELVWREMPIKLRRALRDFCRYPTESNSAYFVGYMSAMQDHQLISWLTYTYLLALSGGIERRQEVRDLVLEYNPEGVDDGNL